MAEPTPILSFENATIESSDVYDSGIWNASFSLNAGELALVRLEPGQRRLPVSDAASGLVEPTSGAVLFEGKSWQAISPNAAACNRGCIGRVFDGVGWISNLNVDENITLSQRHHTRRPVKEIEDEAAELSRAFGLPGMPRNRPHQVRPADLRRAACVRALLGGPKLLLFERPTSDLYADITPPLINAVRAARSKGTAVVWLTEDPRIWDNAGLRPTFKFQMAGAQMMKAEKDR